MDYICHLHFLRDIGKDLFGQEYSLLFNNLMKQHTICSLLRAELKIIETLIKRDSSLTQDLLLFEKSDSQKSKYHTLHPVNLAYVLIVWILDYESELQGYGFPFDRAYLILFKRIEEAISKINSITNSTRYHKHLSKLLIILNKVLKDINLVKNVRAMEEKIVTFERLRKALRIALSEGNRGLNDDGAGEDMHTIKNQLNELMQDKELQEKALNDLSYKKFFKQIEKYWDKLFTAAISIPTPNGIKIIYPQRTNNILEQFFTKLKMLYRKRQGIHALTKTLKSMIAETPLIHNLNNPEYMRILLKDKCCLSERFADIEVKQVRERLKKHHSQPNKISPQLKKMLKDEQFLARFLVIDGQK